MGCQCQGVCGEAVEKGVSLCIGLVSFGIFRTRAAIKGRPNLKVINRLRQEYYLL